MGRARTGGSRALPLPKFVPEYDSELRSKPTALEQTVGDLPARMGQLPSEIQGIAGGSANPTVQPFESQVVQQVLDAAKTAAEELGSGIEPLAFATNEMPSGLKLINLADATGKSALMLATEQGHVGAVRLLLSAGADRQLEDGDGRTPLMVARSAGKEDFARMLGEEQKQAVDQAELAELAQDAKLNATAWGSSAIDGQSKAAPSARPNSEASPSAFPASSNQPNSGTTVPMQSSGSTMIAEMAQMAIALSSFNSEQAGSEPGLPTSVEQSSDQSWTVKKWVDSLSFGEPITSLILQPLQQAVNGEASAVQQFEFVKALSKLTAPAMADFLRNSSLLDQMAMILVDGISELSRYGKDAVSDLQGKYVEDASFTYSYGDLNSWFKGVQTPTQSPGSYGSRHPQHQRNHRRVGFALP